MMNGSSNLVRPDTYYARLIFSAMAEMLISGLFNVAEAKNKRVTRRDNMWHVRKTASLLVTGLFS